MKVVEKLESLQAALDDFKDEIRLQGDKILRDAAKEVFDEVEGLTKFFCRGYTPGFNDGEPCTHSSDGYWGNLGYSYCRYDNVYCLTDDDGVEQEPDFFGAGFDCIYDQPRFNSAEECPKVEYANSGVADGVLATRKVGVMPQLCDVMCHTNYKVFFTKRDDGDVDVVYEDYDCGY